MEIGPGAEPVRAPLRMEVKESGALSDAVDTLLADFTSLVASWRRQWNRSVGIFTASICMYSYHNMWYREELKKCSDDRKYNRDDALYIHARAND